MTAGIDIQKHFNSFIHIYTGKDETPDAFLQACFRVRHYTDKSHTIFMNSSRLVGYCDTPKSVEK